MPTIVVETEIQAPVERCFDAARDIGLHMETVRHTRERAVAGVMHGLIGPGQSVTFEAIHFGVRQRFTSCIAEFAFPTRFVDEMTQGTFKTFRHVHEFFPNGENTVMRDTVTWIAPLGVLGTLADIFFLKRYLNRFIRERGILLKQALEHVRAQTEESTDGA